MHTPLVVLLLSSASALASSLPFCNTTETAEAENAFKNCVESAQAGIIAQVVARKEEARASSLCSSLDSMLSVCAPQTSQLAECKGSTHADKVARLHLSATADIIHSLSSSIDVQQCSVFTEKTATPFQQDNDMSNEIPENAVEKQPRSEPSVASPEEELASSPAPMTAVGASLAACLCLALSV